MDLESVRGASECAGLLFGFEGSNDTAAVAAIGMWKAHFIVISKGGGKGVETCFRFSSLSMARHFHGQSRAQKLLASSSVEKRSRRFYPRATTKNPIFGLAQRMRLQQSQNEKVANACTF